MVLGGAVLTWLRPAWGRGVGLTIQTRVAIALGIVFLITVKPGLVGVLLTIGVAVVLGQDG